MIHFFGIRHHGPGSAKHVKAGLEALRPDLILVEGPPEGESILKNVIHPEMKPPVAMLAYQVDTPSKAVFYPFAEFSPEWQGLTYGIYNNVPIRFFDLPLIHKFVLEEKNEKNENQTWEKHPMNFIAEAAGFESYDDWWELTFEQNQDAGLEYFEAINEMMFSLRKSFAERDNYEEKLREAFMRTNLRAAQKDGYQRIVVICGAWHVPALLEMPPQKEDDILIKKLPKTKVETTWIPWTNSRLSFESGYGAGINAPGWYEYLWEAQNNDNGAAWLIRVAELFRTEKMDISPAHVIETQRLAHTLAALREKSVIGLLEMNEAVQTVMCMGNDSMMKLIQKQLIVKDKIGETPSGVPKVPLLLDVEIEMKKLRLKAAIGKTELELDLRAEKDLAKSQFLHRLKIIGINWGEIQTSKGKGTFKENWVLEWSPELWLSIIENAIWGNTLEMATTNFLKDKILNTNELYEITKSLNHAIKADLPGIIEGMTSKIMDLAADTSDISELMKAFSPLAFLIRYGNVRKTDAAVLIKISDSLITRISIGLPNASGSLDEEASKDFCKLLLEVKDSVDLLNIEVYSEMWYAALKKIVDAANTSAYIAGTSCRILRDAKQISPEETAQKLSQRLSVGEEPYTAVQWLEGFLKNSAMVLILDDTIFSLLDQWVQTIDNENFMSILPLLRRTFSEYSKAEKGKIGEKAKRGTSSMLQGKYYDSEYEEDQVSKILNSDFF
jgi:hypothetical protein